MPVIDVDLPLRSWTRNVPAEEALGLLDLAVPGRELPDWEAEAESTLSHEDRTYRRTLARLVGRMFLDVQEGIIQESRFLDLLADGPDRRRADLLAIRYALAHLWPLEAARRLVRPALLSGQDEVPIAAFDEFVRALIEEDASAASRRKTRSTVIGSLVSLGVAQRAAAATGPVTLLRGRPDPLAFGWALSEQLEGELRAECSAAWAVSLSDAAMLFGVTEDYGEACIRAAVAKGLLMGSEGTLALPR